MGRGDRCNMTTPYLWARAVLLLCVCCNISYATDQLWWEWQILANGRASDYLGNNLALGRYTDSPGATTTPSGPNAVLGMSRTAYLSASADKRLFSSASGSTLEMPLGDYQPTGHSAQVSTSPAVDSRGRTVEIQACAAVGMQGVVQI